MFGTRSNRTVGLKNLADDSELSHKHEPVTMHAFSTPKDPTINLWELEPAKARELSLSRYQHLSS